MTVYPLAGQSNTTIKLTNINDILQVSTGGFAVYDPTGTYYSFQIEPDGHGIHRWINIQQGHAVLRVTANPSANVYPLASTSYGGLIHGTGPTAGAANFTIDSFDNSNPSQLGSAVSLRRFRGTVDSPTAIQSGDLIGSVEGYGFDGTSINVNSASGMGIRATQTHTPTAHGAQIEFGAVPNNTIYPVLMATITPSGSQPGLTLNQTGSGITFTDNTFQTTAWRGTTAASNITGLSTKIGRAHV